MWYALLIGSLFIVAIVFLFLGYWLGRKRCMIENHILYGKDADNFIRRARENELASEFEDVAKMRDKMGL